jgi:hypothetical protein
MQKNTPWRWLVLLLIVLGGTGIWYRFTARQRTQFPPSIQVLLEPLLLQAGDFPKDVVAAPLSEHFQPREALAAFQSASQEFDTTPPGTAQGWVTVSRYHTATELQNAFDELTYIPLSSRMLGISHSPVIGLGEQSMLIGPGSLGAITITFVRCGAIADVLFEVAPAYATFVDREKLIFYAKRLDTRLQKTICQ